MLCCAYVRCHEQAAMVETARIVSLEGAALVERQTSGVLGDIKKLTLQIQVCASAEWWGWCGARTCRAMGGGQIASGKG